MLRKVQGVHHNNHGTDDRHGDPNSASTSQSEKNVSAKLQNWLLYLRHCYGCQAQPCHTYGAECTSGKELCRHIISCNEAMCTYHHCRSCKQLLQHHATCSAQECTICGPVNDKLQKDKELAQYTLGSKPVCRLQNTRAVLHLVRYLARRIADRPSVNREPLSTTNSCAAVPGWLAAADPLLGEKDTLQCMVRRKREPEAPDMDATSVVSMANAGGSKRLRVSSAASSKYCASQ